MTMKHIASLACAAVSLLRLPGAKVIDARAGDLEDRSGVGFKIRSFSLKDQRGKPVSLAKIANDKPAVIAFLGTECPLAQLYGPRLADLAAEYEPKGVVFLAVDANPQDTRAELLAFTKSTGIKFPMVRDMGTAIADHFAAKRTPEVYVLDRHRVVRYRGRIDDQYGLQNGISYKKNKPERRDLAEAISEVLAEKTVSQPITESMGCLISCRRETKTDAAVTYTRDIAPIFYKHCTECHRDGEIAPFPLLQYEDVSGWEDMIREVVSDGRMPPWHADPQHGHFQNDCRLSDNEKKSILDWLDAGCPEGSKSDLTKPPKFVAGWQITKPDLVIDMRSTPFEVQAEGTVNYQYFRVDPGFKEDMWIQAAEARPGNRSVVHHIIVFIEPKDGKQSIIPIDGFLVATAPGARPLVLPPGMAKRVPAGSKLKFQMHYTPNGKAQTDLSSVGLVFADPDSVNTVVRTEAAFNIGFSIPPGADDFAVKTMLTMRQDKLLISLYPHMHLRGKAFRYTARVFSLTEKKRFSWT